MHYIYFSLRYIFLTPLLYLSYYRQKPCYNIQTLMNYKVFLVNINLFLKNFTLSYLSQINDSICLYIDSSYYCFRFQPKSRCSTSSFLVFEIFQKLNKISKKLTIHQNIGFSSKIKLNFSIIMLTNKTTMTSQVSNFYSFFLVFSNFLYSIIFYFILNRSESVEDNEIYKKN